MEKHDKVEKKLCEATDILKNFVAEEKQRLQTGQPISPKNQQRLHNCRKILKEVVRESYSNAEYMEIK